MNLPPEEPHFGPWTVEPLETFVRLLASRCPDASARPCIVAIDGRSASGKSTLATLIYETITSRATVVHTDDLPSSGNWSRATVVRTDDIAWHHSFFDWAALLLEKVLEPARAGQEVRYRPSAWDDWGREEGAITVPQGCSTLILEGVGAARRELMHLLDLVIWVQADLKEAKARGVERDGGDAEAAAFWEKWMAEEFPFLADQRPWERADIVVSGTSRNKHALSKYIVVSRNRHLRAETET